MASSLEINRVADDLLICSRRASSPTRIGPLRWSVDRADIIDRVLDLGTEWDFEYHSSW